MNNFKIFMSVLAVVITSSETSAATNKVFCYFRSWSGSRTGNGAFNVEDINATLCTHIAYSFIGLNTDGSVKLLDSGTLFDRFINLKDSNPNVKLLVAMGGWNENSTTFSAMAASNITRNTFVTSVYNFLIRHGFDGFDLNWEYPGLRGGDASQDKGNFITLLKELKEKLGVTKILSAAVGPAETFFRTSYNVVQMNQYLDLINVITYQYHGSSDQLIGQHSPLYASSIDPNSKENQNASINAWIRAGASPEKLLMGVALYGQSFTLLNVNDNNSGAASSGDGSAGPYTLTPGMLSYLEICEKLKSSPSDWTTVFDEQQMNPYSYNGNQWIGYDNTRSVRKKSGIMVWAIDYDDHKNICGGGAYPMLNTINVVLSEAEQTTTAQTTTTLSMTTLSMTTLSATTLSTTTLSTTTLSATTTAIPTTTEPSTTRSTTTEPSTTISTTIKPSTTISTTIQPSTTSSTTTKPSTTSSTTIKPSTTSSTTIKPSTTISTTIKPSTTISTTAKPTPPKATTTKPTTAKPTPPKATTTKPTTAKPTPPKATTTKATTAKPTPPKATTIKPTMSIPPKPTTINSSTTRSTTTKPSTTRSTTTKPITTRFPTTKPSTTRSTTSKPSTTRYTTTKPSTTRSTTTKLTTTRSTTTKAFTTTRPDAEEFLCTSTGVFRDPVNCIVYYTCVSDDHGGYRKFRSECKYGLVFDVLRSICNYSWAVQC